MGEENNAGYRHIEGQLQGLSNSYTALETQSKNTANRLDKLETTLTDFVSAMQKEFRAQETNHKLPIWQILAFVFIVVGGLNVYLQQALNNSNKAHAQSFKGVAARFESQDRYVALVIANAERREKDDDEEREKIADILTVLSDKIYANYKLLGEEGVAIKNNTRAFQHLDQMGHTNDEAQVVLREKAASHTAEIANLHNWLEGHVKKEGTTGHPQAERKITGNMNTNRILP